MEKISDRVKKIVDIEKLSIRSIESDIDCSNGVLAKFIKNGTDISSHWMSKLIDRFSEYNARWIMTGKGEMIQPKEENVIPDIQYNNFLLSRIEQLAIENNNLKQEIQALKTQKKYHNTIVPDIAAEPELIQHRATKNK